MPQINLNTVNQKNTPALYTDIFANLPNYGIPGRLFISTDTQQIFEDSGTAWSVVANVTSTALVGTLQQVTANGSTTSIGITITAGGLTSNAVTISGGTSNQFLKANGTLDSSAYITLTNLSATGPVTYNNSSGVIGIGQATNSTSGYLSSTDWNTFNGKQSAITLTVTGSSGAATLIGSTLNIPNYTYTLPQATGAVLGGVVIGSNISVASGVISLTNTNITTALGFTPYNATNPNSYISLTSLSGSAPISYSNTTGSIGISQAGGSTNGYLTSTDWNTFNNKLSTSTASNTYVPYTGATGSLTMGSNDITARNLTATSTIYSNSTGGSIFVATAGTSSMYFNISTTISSLAFGPVVAANSIFTGTTAGAIAFGTSSNYPLQFFTNNALSLTIASSGAATFSSSLTAGAISGSTGTFSGAINSTLTSGAVLQNTAATTSQLYLQFINTSGRNVMGIESSVGGALLIGAPAYATVFGSVTSTSLVLGTNNTTALTINSSQQATFASSVTASSFIKSGGTSSQSLQADGSTLNLTSGTYTPTLANVSNVATTTAYVCTYSQVGSTVIVMGQLTTTATSSTTLCTVSMTLPIASNLSNGSRDLNGSGAANGAAQLTAVQIQASGTKAYLTYYPAITPSLTVSFIFMYIIN